MRQIKTSIIFTCIRSKNNSAWFSFSPLLCLYIQQLKTKSAEAGLHTAIHQSVHVLRMVDGDDVASLQPQPAVGADVTGRHFVFVALHYHISFLL